MSHVVMSKSLAKALMDSGMQHFDLGGLVNGFSSSGGSGIGGTFSGWMGSNNNFNASDPNITKQNLLPYIQGQQQNQADVYKQQQSLANQLLQQSQGGGPNPALAQLNQATGANVANQAALMAGQRGASVNPALVARMAAQQGQQAQQQAAGQAAVLQAQQQLGAQGVLAQQQAQMANQSIQGQGVGQGALAAQNSAITSGSLGAQGINSQVAGQNAATNAGLAGGLLGGLGAGGIRSAFGFNKGGQVQGMADGGIAQYETPGMFTPPALYNMAAAGEAWKQAFSPKSGGGGSNPLAGMGSPVGSNLMAGGAGDAGGLTGMAPLLMMASQGGQIPFNQMLAGGHVPGEPQVEGDSEKNDVVPTMLSPGEIVLPRSVTQGGDVEKKAVEFLKHLKTKKPRGYQAVAEARRAK